MEITDREASWKETLSIALPPRILLSLSIAFLSSSLLLGCYLMGWGVQRVWYSWWIFLTSWQKWSTVKMLTTYLQFSELVQSSQCQTFSEFCTWVLITSPRIKVMDVFCVGLSLRHSPGSLLWWQPPQHFPEQSQCCGLVLIMIARCTSATPSGSFEKN